MVVISVDFSSHVSEWNDFIVNDDLSYTFVNNIANIVAYPKGFALPVEIQKIKHVTIWVENCLTCVTH